MAEIDYSRGNSVVVNGKTYQPGSAGHSSYYAGNPTALQAAAPNNGIDYSQGSNISAGLEGLKQAQQTQAMAGLDKQRAASLSNLSAERATIQPQYQKAKTQANVTAKQTARSFDEYMAQRGGGAAKSGIAGQGALLNNMAYQRQYGELDQAEKGALTENARRVTDVGNAYESDVVGANAGIEAQYLQNWIQQQNADRTFNQQNDQFNKNYGLQRDQFNQGINQFDQTFGLQQDQFNRGNYESDRNYGLQERVTNANVAQSQASTALNNAQLAEIQNPNSVTNQMARIGLDTARLNYAALPEQLKMQAAKIAQDLQLGRINIQTAQTQLDYLPAMSQAQIAATNRSNMPTSGQRSSDQTDYYNGFISENAGEDGEELYKNLTANKDAYVDAMGTSNYNKAVTVSQDKYYNAIVDRWRGSYYALKDELRGKQDYYKVVLGTENYNKAMKL